jgi:adenylate cyclase
MMNSKESPNDLDLSNQKLKDLDDIKFDKDITRLCLRNNLLTTLPMDLTHLAHLRYLNIRSNNLHQFPQAVCNCLI